MLEIKDTEAIATKAMTFIATLIWNVISASCDIYVRHRGKYKEGIPKQSKKVREYVKQERMFHKAVIAIQAATRVVSASAHLYRIAGSSGRSDHHLHSSRLGLHIRTGQLARFGMA